MFCLAQAERRLMKAEKVLAKVEESLKPAEHTSDPESITEEERFMFRKLGLRMKAFLLLGNIFTKTAANILFGLYAFIYFMLEVQRILSLFFRHVDLSYHANMDILPDQ